MFVRLPVRIVKVALAAVYIAFIFLAATHTADGALRPTRLAVAQAIATHTAADRSLIELSDIVPLPASRGEFGMKKLLALVLGVGSLVGAPAFANCTNSDVSGLWAFTKTGLYDYSYCKIYLRGIRVDTRKNNTCTLYASDASGSTEFTITSGTIRVTSAGYCAVAINVSNSLGATVTGQATLSKDGNTMVGLVRNQGNVPMQVTAVKIW